MYFRYFPHEVYSSTAVPLYLLSRAITPASPLGTLVLPRPLSRLTLKVYAPLHRCTARFLGAPCFNGHRVGNETLNGVQPLLPSLGACYHGRRFFLSSKANISDCRGSLRAMRPILSEHQLCLTCYPLHALRPSGCTIHVLGGV